MSSVVNFTEGDERSMATVIGLHNPVSVAFEVVSDLRYALAILDSFFCTNLRLSITLSRTRLHVRARKYTSAGTSVVLHPASARGREL